MLEGFFHKVENQKACNFIKKRLHQRYFLVNFAEFLRTAFFIEHLRWLPLDECPGTLPNNFLSRVESFSAFTVFCLT